MPRRKVVNGSTKAGTRHPLSYADEAEFLRDVRDTYHLDLQADQHNAEPAREDMRFVIGDQWHTEAKARRTRLKKPVLTVNRLPAFVAQYIGSWLQSDTSIKLMPSRGGTQAIAEIRQGIIRTILRTRKNKQALKQAMTNAYICGVGNFGVELADSKFDVFARDIVLKTIDDPLAVVWDRASREPTGADAQHCYVVEYLTKRDFARTYPKAASDAGWYANELDDSTMTAHGWEVDDMVRICYFWQMGEEKVTVALEADTGDVIEVTDWTDEELAAKVAIGEDGQLITRDTVKPYAECYVLTSNQVLEGPIRLYIPRLPIFRVEGWTLQEAAVRYRWGFVRNAKDPQRLHNFWRSILAEELMKSPASKWLFDKASDKQGISQQFRNAHLSGDPILYWDSSAGGAKPEFLAPPMINQAVLTEATMTVQDIRDVTNRHEASMGQVSNEVSGRAITARQRVSELGDVIYTENMDAALAEAGLVINELIPVVYDTNRTVKITGDDDVELLQEINGQMADATPDVTLGKYDMSYSTGPSYATKRQEAVDVTMTLMNTMPQVGNVVADILVRNMDIPGAKEIEERLATLLPPGMVNVERLPTAQRERVMKQQEAAAKQAELEAQKQQAIAEAEIAKIQAEAMELKARAMKQMAQAKRELSEVGVQGAKVMVQQAGVEIDAHVANAEVDKLAIDVFQMGLAGAQDALNPPEDMEDGSGSGKDEADASDSGGGEST